MSALPSDRLADTYRFSLDVVTLLHNLYGTDVERVLQAMKRPHGRYYFRANTLKSDTDRVYTQLSSKGFKVHRDQRVEEALYLEVEGPYAISPCPKTLTVDKFTAEAVLQGAYVYAPGIVDCKGLRYGEKVAILDEKGWHIANGIAEMGEASILELRRGLAVRVTESLYRAPSLGETEEYLRGEIYLQSLPAMVTGRVLDPQPKDVVVDFNCAPGGKLSHICQLTRNGAEVYGMDRTKAKIAETRNNLNRLGCKNAVLTIQDTRYLDRDHPNLKADKCLIDPPCSALGVIPKVYDETTFQKIRALAEYQKQFLSVASRILKPHGRVAYSVCTISIGECEEVVAFAEAHCDLELVEQPLYLGSPGFNAVSRPSLVQRFHPHIHGAGYFIALFEKKGKS